MKHHLGSSSGGVGSWGSWGLALETEAEQPSSVVELSVVDLDLGQVVADDHVVDTDHGGPRWCGSVPLPCDLLAAVGDKESLNH